jgi:quercetin dioxygenase-like cupin family protein
MNPLVLTTRLALLGFAALFAASSASAQTAASVQPPSGAAADPERPVTAPDSYRVVMENDRVRMIEVHVKPRSKVNVESPAERERFLYMLTDGALVLAAPGKTPYEFALQAGETAVFPAVSPVVQNDTDQPVRALMVEVKSGGRAVAGVRGKSSKFAKGKGRAKSAVRSGSRKGTASSSRSKAKQAAKPRKKVQVNAPLNLRNANLSRKRR